MSKYNGAGHEQEIPSEIERSGHGSHACSKREDSREKPFLHRHPAPVESGKDGGVHCEHESAAPPGDTVPDAHFSHMPVGVRKNPGGQVRAGAVELQYVASRSDVEPEGHGRHEVALLFG